MPLDRRFDPRAAALVLKIGRYRLHHGGLAVVRSLGRAGIAVYGVHEDRFTPAALSAHLAGGFVWPTAREGAARQPVLEAMTRIARRLDRPCVVIPTDDKAAVLLNDCTAALPDLFLLPACRPGLARSLTDKRTFAEASGRAGLPMPNSIVLHCPAPDSTIADVPLPVVVKRLEPALLADGSRTFSTMVVQTPQVLRQVLQDETGDAYDVMLQEQFPGDDWLYHGYCDAASEALVSFTGRKLHSRPPDAGETAFARAEPNDELREAVERFLKDIGYVGPVSMDLRHDRRAGRYRLLDVNPRVGACFRLFVNVHAIDVVRALHLDLTGREVPRGPQVDGRTYLVEGYDLSARRAYGPGGIAGTLAWLRRLRRADELAWLHRDDPVPAIAGLLQLFVGRLRAHGALPTAPTDPRYFRGRARRTTKGSSRPHTELWE